MAVGFRFSYDLLVKAKRFEFHFGLTNNAAKTESTNPINSRNDILGQIISERQSIKQTFLLRSYSNRYISNANVIIFSPKNILSYK